MTCNVDARWETNVPVIFGSSWSECHRPLLISAKWGIHLKTHKGCCTILVVGAVSVYFLLFLAALLKEYLHVTKQKCFTFVIIQYLVSVQGNTRFKRQKFCFNHSPWWSLTKVQDKRHCRKKWQFFFFRTISCEKRDVIALYLMLYLRVYVKAMVCFNLNK